MSATATIVLDNEAAQALQDPHHRKHRRLVALLEAHAGLTHARRERPAVLVPTVVRVEALLEGRSGSRLKVQDVGLDRARAQRAASLRREAGGSTVDACVAEVAASTPGNVVVLTSDLTDLPALLRAAGSAARCHRV